MLADHHVIDIGWGASGFMGCQGDDGRRPEPGGEQVHVVDSPTVSSSAVDRTNLHLIWKAILIGIALLVATACYFAPVLLVALGVLPVFLLFARLVYRG